MLSSILDFFLNIWANKFLAFGLYWFPCIVSLTVFSARSIKNYALDSQKKRQGVTSSYDYSGDTVGTIFFRLFWPFVPVINIISLLFHAIPGIFDTISKFFQIRLVTPPSPQNRS